MSKQNCWEAKNCGRQPGGAKTKELGVCPAATSTKFNGINSGKNGGRACWVLSGTLCGGQVQGSFALKYHNCTKCDFYLRVKNEEGAALHSSKALLDLLKTG